MPISLAVLVISIQDLYMTKYKYTIKVIDAIIKLLFNTRDHILIEVLVDLIKRLSLIFNQSIVTIYKIKREIRRNARLRALCEDVIPSVVPHLE